MKKYETCGMRESHCDQCQFRRDDSTDCHGNPANPVKFLRERCGIKQSELAAQLGIKQPVLSRIESGVVDRRKMQLKTAAAIAGILGVHAEDLL